MNWGDPIGQMRAIDAGLRLPDFDCVEDRLTRYVASLSDYGKNVFPELSPEFRKRIASTCDPCFTEWGYPV